MPYLIDGHNLIPKIGLRLDSPDDEKELIEILQEFSRLKRTEVEVYFDGAPPGSVQSRKIGNIKAHFVRRSSTADAALRQRLRNMKKDAKNWTVVSSDHEVQSAARSSQAEYITSEAFVNLLRKTRESAPKPNGERSLSKNEVDEWMDLFKRGKAE